MSIITIGAVTNDTLIFPKQNWEVKKNLGGILYTVNALANLCEDEIIPICNVGYDIYEEVICFMNNIKNVSTKGIIKVEHKNLHCNIIYSNDYGLQYDEGNETKIKFSQVSDYLVNCKFIIVSSMTGFDFDLPFFKKLRKSTSCPIYFDYHILALDKDILGNRFIRRRKNWFDWCKNADFLQFNKFEAELLAGHQLITNDDLLRFTSLFVESNVKSISVTLGDKGAFVCLKQNQSFQIKYLTPLFVQEIDSTGCGDTFASAFVSSYLKSKNMVESYEFANKIAGIKTTFHGFDKLQEIISTFV